MDNNLTKSKLILFYRYKRTFLLFDEWGFYILLLFMYKYMFPYWIIFPVLFYGGTALYTSYTNLDKIEQRIVNIRQDIYILNDTISDMFSFLINIKDYFHRQTPFSSQN